MSNVKHVYEFDGFRLDSQTPSLWSGDELVPIFPKALDLLVLLVDRHGEIVSREELLDTVWPDTFVEEANVNYTVSLLRKALSEDKDKQFIQTVPKRGYRFVAEVRRVEPHEQRQTNGGGPVAISEELTSPARAQIRWHFIGLVLLGLLLVTSFAAWWKLTGQRGLSDVPVNERNIRTIAILPLTSLNGGNPNNPLAIGLTDSLISRLGSLNRFAVRPLSSVKDYAESGQNPIEFGERLSVDAVLEGTLQQTDDRLRLNIRLWDVRDGAQLWQDSFDSSEADFFRLQDIISTRVTESLVSELLETDRKILSRRDTENRDAFDAYWRGRSFIEKRNPQKAIAEFGHAIDLDPDYAIAYAGLADAYIWQANFTSSSDPELYEKAKAAADKALSIDPDLADAHSSLARIKYSHDWDWTGAEESFRRAIELNPNGVNARQFYSRLLTTLGRYEEALTQIYKARELDPRSADLGIPLYGILEKQRKYDEGLKVLSETLAVDEDSQFGRRGTAKLYLLKGDYSKVIELGSEHYPDLSKVDFAWASMLATAYHMTGNTRLAAELRGRLKKLAETDPKSLYFLALHDTEIGRKEEALAALEKCLELHEERMIWTKDEPRFANISNEPAFKAILQKLRLD